MCESWMKSIEHYLKRRTSYYLKSNNMHLKKKYFINGCCRYLDGVSSNNTLLYVKQFLANGMLLFNVSQYAVLKGIRVQQ